MPITGMTLTELHEYVLLLLGNKTHEVYPEGIHRINQDSCNVTYDDRGK